MNLFPFIITTIAGLSTLIGYFFIKIKTKNQDKIIALSLSLSASVMISLSVLELIPESFKTIIKTHTTFHTILITLILINIGAIITLLIDTLTNKINNKLYTVGIISVIAIILHNIPEGIITYLAGNTNKKLGISLMIAIALHNIPEGISIAIPLYYSTKNKLKTLKYLTISALSEIIGAIIASIFFKNQETTFISYISLIIAGIMIFLALFEQIPIITKIKEKNKIKIFLLGILIIYITIKIM